MKQIVLAELAALLLIGCAHAETGASEQSAASNLVEQGHRLASENCASCHAIGRTGDASWPARRMFDHGNFEGDQFADPPLGNAGNELPVDHTDRQMPEKIDHS